jgi:hemoglobin
MATDGEEVEVTLFEAVGGIVFFEQLVEVFYRNVQADPVLISLYPEQDLGPAKRRLATFLAQYWGGPMTYAEERGNPALKMRHFPFAIGPLQRDHWIDAMRIAVDEVDPIPQARIMLMDYFTMSAEHLRNDQPMRFTGSA